MSGVWWMLASLVCITVQLIVEDTVPIIHTSAVLTGVARLPCDLTPPGADDRVSLVIWYKDGGDSPIYSLDVRGRSLQQPTHWADERTLGGRSFFRVSEVVEEGGPSFLAVENVRLADRGSYRCRVDFRRSPTRNSVVRLTVIVPPSNVTIYDEDGAAVQRNVVGPYEEGGAVRLTCVAVAGDPPAHVTWWRDGHVVPSLTNEHTGHSTLLLQPLQRSHVDAVYTCQAANNNVLAALTANVTIDMHLQPLQVRMLGQNDAVSAGSRYEVACEVVGARPPLQPEWRLGGRRLSDRGRHTTSGDANVTTSTLTLVPQVSDQGSRLECSVANLTDGWTLDILYSPVVTLELGSNLNGSSLREGADVYFECVVRANPRPYRVAWRHNGLPLKADPTTRTLISNQTLVLQSVGRHQAGLYTCVGANQEGDSESNVLLLDVTYPPECRPGQQKVYGAARQEEVHVSCHVDANPPASYFRWEFNSSAVAGAHVGDVTSRPGGSSVAVYTPRGERDYGTLLCWGRNGLGAQAVPCVFHVVPAGRPDAPKDCSAANRTSSSLHVVCSPGFDGGLPQQFTLEVFSTSGPRRLVANVTSRSRPHFWVSGLEPGSSYLMTAYASNGKGRSAAAPPLRADTMGAAGGGQRHHRREGTDSAPLWPPPHLWLVLTSATAMACVCAGAALAVRVRVLACDGDDEEGTGESPGGARKAHCASRDDSKGAGAEDGGEDPDIIMHTNDLDFPAQAYKEQQAQSVRLGPPRGRDMATQAQAPLHPPRHQHAGTQTPLLIRHKESAV